MRGRLLAAALVVLLAACTNNPYPAEDAEHKVRYRALSGAPKTLDPAVSYTVPEHKITANVYEALLEYHYLLRPYRLIPGLARAVPELERRPDGRYAYRFDLRPGMLFEDDACFGAFGEPRRTREVLASDVAFQLMRLADPAVGSPIVASVEKIAGFPAFAERLQKLREEEEGFAELRIDRQYARAGGIEGVKLHGAHGLEIVLEKPNPQLRFWFALPFTAPVPWEAVAYYDGEDGRDFFKDHPVGAGPYEVALYAKHRRIVLDRDPNWYGVRHPEWQAPGATYPSEGMPEDEEAGRLDPAYTGRPLPFIERIEFRIEKERIPEFNKFLQGYYDQSPIYKEGFDLVMHEGGLSPEMRARGMQLDRGVDLDIWYVSFNMSDPVVGAPGGERARRLRQALSLAIDAEEFTRIFANGRGIPAHSLIPPGLFGYDPDYVNPYRVPDLSRARERLAEAGYADGIDPETGEPLVLSIAGGNPATSVRLQYEFLAQSWEKLGLDVDVEATDFNQFQDKVDRGAFQIILWGWLADYPDPENFLFLLWGPMSRSRAGGPNSANFDHDGYDRLFLAMRDRSNDERRFELIREMLGIVERERPWIELFHRETYALYHGWMKNVKSSALVSPSTKYIDIDLEERNRLRSAWNEPIVWPAWAMAGLVVVLVVPGIVTFFRERQ